MRKASKEYDYAPSSTFRLNAAYPGGEVQYIEIWPLISIRYLLRIKTVAGTKLGCKHQLNGGHCRVLQIRDVLTAEAINSSSMPKY